MSHTEQLWCPRCKAITEHTDIREHGPPFQPKPGPLSVEIGGRCTVCGRIRGRYVVSLERRRAK